jgi:toluene monooxygenase system protein D
MSEDQRLVGPIIRGFDPDIIEALHTAIEQDNPDTTITIDDRGGYVRIHAPRYLRITRASLEQAAGRPLPLPTLEPALAGFAGRIKYIDDTELVFYLDRENDQ